MYLFSIITTIMIALPFLLFLVSPIVVGLTFGVLIGGSRRAIRIGYSKRPRILIVDDEISSVLPLMTVLENGSTDVHYVSSGEEMIRELASRAYDLVFLDSKMPLMSGEKSLEQGDELLRLDHPVSVIFYSGSALKIDVPRNLKHFDIKGVWNKSELSNLERDVASVVQSRQVDLAKERPTRSRVPENRRSLFYNQG